MDGIRGERVSNSALIVACAIIDAIMGQEVISKIEETGRTKRDGRDPILKKPSSGAVEGTKWVIIGVYLHC